MPQWLQEHRKKKMHVKEKKYAEPKKKGGNGMMGSMNMMMYMSTGMIAIFAINWPLGMSLSLIHILHHFSHVNLFAFQTLRSIPEKGLLLLKYIEKGSRMFPLLPVVYA